MVSYLSCILLIFSLNTLVGAQTEPVETAKPSPLEVDVSKMSDGPLSLSLKSIDETPSSYRVVNYTIRNNTDKAIRASVLKLENHPGGNGTITSYYGRFPGNGVHDSVLRVERKNQTTKVSFEVDFVLFTDGSTWGSDSLKRSGEVFAHYKGKDAAVEQFKHLVEANDVTRMNEIFAVEISKLEPPTIPADMAEPTKRAFASGYRSTVFGFKRDFEARGIQGIAERLRNPDSF